MTEPCLCGAPDCRRCFPSTWWHDADNCTGDGECDCVDPYDYEPDFEPEPDDDYWADVAADRYEQSMQRGW